MVDTIAPAGMYILCIALRYNKPNKSEIINVSYLLCFFNKTRASVLFLGFPYFELRDILNYEIFIAKSYKNSNIQ